MAAVKKLCSSCILLKKGTISSFGDTDKIVDIYLSMEETPSFTLKNLNTVKNKPLFFKSLKLYDVNLISKQAYSCSEDVFVEIDIIVKEYIKKSSLFITVIHKNEMPVFSAEIEILKNKTKYILRIKKKFLAKGNYKLDAFIHIPQVKRFDTVTSVCSFAVIDDSSPFTIHGNFNHGVVFGNYEWK